jgi:hypothetical protein
MRTNLGLTRSRQVRSGVSESSRRAWVAMAHPITWVCIVTLLVNDQLLRWRWPSWLTGKLGDVAWLAFAPLVVALRLTMLRCATGKDMRRQDQVIWVAILLVGGVFAVVKAVPIATAAFHTAFHAVFGWQPLLVRDPTDLLTLPALGIAWLVWRDSARGSWQVCPPASTKDRGHSRISGWGWVGLGLALLATLGNSGPPDVGIVCVEKVGDRLLAGPQYGYAFTHTYQSTDGGLTWEETALQLNEGAEAACEMQEKPWVMALPGEEVLYQVLPGGQIQRSADGGATWATELSLPGTEARVAYIRSWRSGADGGAGPHNAVFDPATGNLVMAMGLEGVLVRRQALTESTPELWAWVAVGDYRFERPTAVEATTTLLRLEALLAMSVIGVTAAFLGWPSSRWPLRALAVICALGIVGALLVLRPALMTGYATMVGTLVCLALAVGGLILGVVAAVRTWRRSFLGGWRGLVEVVGVGLVSGILFLLPLALWAVGVISHYTMAMWIATFVLAATWGYAATRKRQVEPGRGPG